MKIPFLCKNISVEGISCGIAHSFHDLICIFEGGIFPSSPRFLADAKMMYDGMLCDMII
jgi:hypothetical protein